MKNLKLSNLFSLALLVFAPVEVIAAELLIFDKPNFVAVKNKSSLTGYYVGKSNQSRLFSDTTVDYPCIFYIKGVDFDDPIRIRAFPDPVSKWEDKPYTEGTIVTTADVWYVRFSEIPQGCQSKPDGEQFLAKTAQTAAQAMDNALDNQGAPLKIIKSETSIGIMVVKRKSVAYLEENKKFAPSDIAIPPDEIVVVIRKIGKFSLVRHVSGDGKLVRRLWLKSADLMNPFPN